MITKVISGTFYVCSLMISVRILKLFLAVVGYPLTFYVISTFKPAHDIWHIGQIKIYV